MATGTERRQAFHVCPNKGWLNDPNGLLYHHGSFHCFYQHYPNDTKWGPMHWGHAYSKDLVVWKHLPIALYPDRPYDSGGCFSGSAIMSNKKMWLIYTGHSENKQDVREVQCIAYSTDGIHFFKDDKNPVISAALLPSGYSLSDFRDPRILCYGGCLHAYVAARKINGKGRILVFKSTNMTSWEFEKELWSNDLPFGDMTECPDFAPSLKLYLTSFTNATEASGTANLHASMYCVGNDFSKFRVTDYGFDFYAPQLVKDDSNRYYMIGWQNMWGRNNPSAKYGWAGSMSIPRMLNIGADGELHQTPISLERYYKEKVARKFKEMKDPLKLTGKHYVLKLTADSFEDFELELRADEKISTTITIDKQKRELIFDRSRSGEKITGDERDKDSKRGIRRMPLKGDSLNLTIVVDEFSVEIFSYGRVLSSMIYPPETAQGINLSGSFQNLSVEKNEIMI